MNRRGFLGALAGAALVSFAVRTGFARTELALAEPRLEDRFTDPDVWFIKTEHDQDDITKVLRFKCRVRYLPPTGETDWRAIYGSQGA